VDCHFPHFLECRVRALWVFQWVRVADMVCADASSLKTPDLCFPDDSQDASSGVVTLFSSEAVQLLTRAGTRDLGQHVVLEYRTLVEGAWTEVGVDGRVVLREGEHWLQVRSRLDDMLSVESGGVTVRVRGQGSALGPTVCVPCVSPCMCPSLVSSSLVRACLGARGTSLCLHVSCRNS
jgi:hypothetical protein